MATKNSTPAQEQKAADIAPATTFSPSGAPDQVVPDVDPDHPAVDNNPRKGTSVDQNRIDFNDPTKSNEEAVASNLRDQGIVVDEAKPDDKKGN